MKYIDKNGYILCPYCYKPLTKGQDGEYCDNYICLELLRYKMEMTETRIKEEQLRLDNLNFLMNQSKTETKERFKDIKVLEE